MAQMLDLDAALIKDHLMEIINWAAARQPAPRTILDLGAGTGTGTLGLARTFPDASITSVDQSEFMLDRLSAKLEAHGLTGRVSTERVDLDTSWPEAADVDLVWAASSMHHMADPARVFEKIGTTLSADGLLVVVEMDALPRYLPEDLGFGTPGLEERCHAAVNSAGWNSHPDWTADIEWAGMTTTAKRTFDYALTEDRDLVASNAQNFLARLRENLAEALPAEDLSMLDALLDANGPHSVLLRTDLAMRGSRTVWAARPAR